MAKNRFHARNIGNWGEREAEKFLLGQGVSIISKNVRTEYGEIDILGIDENVVVFFEVKTRLSKKFGFPEIAIDPTKEQHMINSAISYLQKHPDIEQNWRIDVIAILKNRNQPYEIKWYKNAISM